MTTIPARNATPVKLPVRQAAQVSAPPVQAVARPKSTSSGAIAGAAVGGGVMAGVFTAVRWFSSAQPAMIAAGAAVIGLAALGGAKMGSFVQRKGEFNRFTVTGAIAGTAALAGLGISILIWASLAANPLVIGSMAVGSVFAAAGAASLGHAAQDKITGLFKGK